MSTHISITSLTKSTFIIAAQSPTGETGGGGGGGGGYSFFYLVIKQYIENINNFIIGQPIGSSRGKVKISIISLTKSTFIIAAQSPTGETGGGGTIGFFYLVA